MAGFRTTLHLRLYAEDATADREHLQLCPVRRDVALSEERLLAGRKIRELAGPRDDPDAVAVPTADRLHDQRSGLEQRSERVHVRCHIGLRRGCSGTLQNSKCDDLVGQRQGHRIGIHDRGALRVQRTGDAEGETAHLLEDVQVVLDAQL